MNLLLEFQVQPLYINGNSTMLELGRYFPSNVAALDPQPITVTTAYRRIASVIYAGLECELPSGSFISNVVTITVDGSLTNNPIISVASSDVTNQIFCKDQDVTFEINPTVPGAIYEYQIGNGARVNSGGTTFTLSYASITGGATITAYVTSGTVRSLIPFLFKKIISTVLELSQEHKQFVLEIFHLQLQVFLQEQLLGLFLTDGKHSRD